MDITERLRTFLNKNGKSNLLKYGVAGLAAAILGGAIYYYSYSQGKKAQLQASLIAAESMEIGAFQVTVPTLKYGFALDTFQVLERKVQNGQSLGSILSQLQMDYPTIEQVVANSNGQFDVRQLRAGKNYTILTKDSTGRADYLIYEPSVYEYIVFHLKDDYQVEKVVKPVTKALKTASGHLESSLWNAIVGQGLSFELADKMEDALQWCIDFHHLSKGDEFQLVYEEEFVDGQPVAISMVHAATYKTGDKEFQSVYYDKTKEKGYYDGEGRPMNKGFLKSPVKYSRISSYYNLNRFHPILKRVRPHFGTDYAAPYGTPILAVGSGVVLEASFTKGNGNYVKIKHNDTYTTQYLHMQGFAKGIRPGTHVQQGEVIGYVGSTGLATGPHVCFRFWKNGQQVNHLNLDFPPPHPLPDDELPEFMKLRDYYLGMMNKTEMPEEDEACVNP